MTGVQVGGWSIPRGCPVFDVDGERVGRVAGIEEDCLVVDRGKVFVDHVPVAAVVGFDGRAVRLGVTMDEVHRGEAERACRHLRRQG